MSFKISICIPTYNRSELLSEAIESVVLNFEGRTDVEVVVSDNASSDDTKSVVDSFKDRIPNLRNFRNRENIGPVRNLRKTIEYAQGDFVWILADDDVLAVGALPRLLLFLDANPEVDYVYYSREIVDYHLNTTQAGVQPQGLMSDMLFANGNDLFCACDGQMPYILGFFSSTIIRRSIWTKAASNTKIVSDGYSWDHLLVILKAIRHRKSAILSAVGVKARLNFRPVKANSRIGFDDSIQVLNEIASLDYSPRQVGATIQQIIKTESRSFVIDKAKGFRNDSIPGYLGSLGIRHYAKYAYFWGIASFIPAWILKILWRFYLSLSSCD